MSRGGWVVAVVLAGCAKPAPPQGLGVEGLDQLAVLADDGLESVDPGFVAEAAVTRLAPVRGLFEPGCRRLLEDFHNISPDQRGPAAAQLVAACHIECPGEAGMRDLEKVPAAARAAALV